MRDLVFKNLTSDDKKRKVLASCEVAEEDGLRSVIQRHFLYAVKEVSSQGRRPLPSLYVLKEHNTKEQKERFFCKIKGSVFAICDERLYLIIFMHTLKINLTAIQKDGRPPAI